MKNTKRILMAVLAMVMVLSVMLTGCSRPQVTFNKVPDTAATYSGGEITTGQYLAYLYLEFENLYYNQGLYQYEMYGMDPWEQSFPYGDTEEKLMLSDYIIRATQDNIKRQIVLQQIMKDNKLEWIAEDLAELNKSIADMQKDAYVSSVNTVILDPEGGNSIVRITDIISTDINTASGTIRVDGYIDIGLRDTMKDMFVNFVGAVVFSFIGYIYVKQRGKGKLAGAFIPTVSGEEQEKQ